MSTQDPGAPLAAIARKAESAVMSEDQARRAALEAKESGAAAGKRTVRLVWLIIVVAGLAGAALYLAPRMLDPYYGNDPLDDPLRARAYVSGLLDTISVYRARHGGALPNTLELAVPESRLPPKGSPYRVEFRVEGGAPVVTLHGDREPLTMKGPAK
jgi:hypothetical protein